MTRPAEPPGRRRRELAPGRRGRALRRAARPGAASRSAIADAPGGRLRAATSRRGRAHRRAGRLRRARTGRRAGAPKSCSTRSRTGAPGLRRTSAGRDGRFRFAGIDDDPSTTYLLGARYAGVSPRGPASSSRPARRRTRRDARRRRHRRRRPRSRRELRVRIDWLGDRLVANETLTLEPGRRTIFVPPEARAARRACRDPSSPPAPAPRAARSAVLPRRAARRALRWFGPLFPGENEVEFVYEVPVAERGRVTARSSRRRSVCVSVLPAGRPRARGTGSSRRREPHLGRSYTQWQGELPTPASRSRCGCRRPARPRPRSSLAEVRVIGELDDAALVGREEHVIRVEARRRRRAPGDPCWRAAARRRANLRFGIRREQDAPRAPRRRQPGVLGPLPPGRPCSTCATASGRGRRRSPFARSFGGSCRCSRCISPTTDGSTSRSDRLHRRGAPRRRTEATSTSRRSRSTRTSGRPSRSRAARRGAASAGAMLARDGLGAGPWHLRPRRAAPARGAGGRRRGP